LGIRFIRAIRDGFIPRLNNVDDCHHEVREARRGDPARLLRRSASRNASPNIKGRWYYRMDSTPRRRDPQPSGLGTSRSTSRFLDVFRCWALQLFTHWKQRGSIKEIQIDGMELSLHLPGERPPSRNGVCIRGH